MVQPDGVARSQERLRVRLQMTGAVSAYDTAGTNGHLERAEQKPGETFRLVRHDAPCDSAGLDGFEQLIDSWKRPAFAADVPFVDREKLLSHRSIVRIFRHHPEADVQKTASPERRDRTRRGKRHWEQSACLQHLVERKVQVRRRIRKRTVQIEENSLDHGKG